IRTSAVREDIIAALDDWARHERDPRRRQRLLQVANRADEPDPWRQAVRQAVPQRDGRRLRQLVRGAGAGQATPGVVLLFTLSFPQESVEPIALLRRMQLERPSDFWVNLALGERLYNQKKHQEAAECFLVAVALRPDKSLAHAALGMALRARGQEDE